MSKCNEKAYQFAKGELLDYSRSYWPIDCLKNEYSYQLLITDGDDVIAAVDPSHVQYIEHIQTIFFFWSKTSEYLYDKRTDANSTGITDLSIDLQGEKFVITDSNNNIVTAIDNFTLTEYGNEVLGECVTSTVEYYTPANNSTDHSDHQVSCETDHDLATNLDIL